MHGTDLEGVIGFGCNIILIIFLEEREREIIRVGDDGAAFF